jgi:hypothetical protein
MSVYGARGLAILPNRIPIRCESMDYIMASMGWRWIRADFQWLDSRAELKSDDFDHRRMIIG